MGTILVRNAAARARPGTGCRGIVARRGHRRPRPDRAARRLRRRQPARCKATRERRQLPAATARRRRSASATRPMRSCCSRAPARAESGAGGVTAFLVPLSLPGVHAHPLRRPRQQARRPRLDLLRRRPHPGRSPRRRGRARLHPGDAGLRLQPRADRAAVHRRGAGVDRRNLGLREGAPDLRPAAGAVPGRDVPAGRVRDACSPRRASFAITPWSCAMPASRTRPRRRW